MQSRRGTAHLPSPHLRCGAGVRAVQGCRAPTRAPQGFQGSVGTKHAPPRRGAGVAGPAERRARALESVRASPLHTRDGMCSRGTLSEMCKSARPRKNAGTPTGTALTHWHCAGAQRQCKCAPHLRAACTVPQAHVCKCGGRAAPVQVCIRCKWRSGMHAKGSGVGAIVDAAAPDKGPRGSVCDCQDHGNVSAFGAHIRKPSKTQP